VHWERGGHAVAQGEIDAAHQWIAQCLTASTA
jgi:predicted esterase